jgi:toxin-antitoxin system PIN domain toxin
VIAVDTNILVHAHRADSAHHASAQEALSGLARGPAPFAIPWPCVHEFFAITTHPRIYDPPSTVEEAMGALERITSLTAVRLLGEGADHLERLAGLIGAGRVVGSRVHGARIAAICLSHGVQELWTADRDFSFFPELRTRNPLVE